MTTLITGKQDSGKTTRLLEHYKIHQQGDGFALLKQMKGTDVLGFVAMRLSTGETKSLLTHQGTIKSEDHPMKIGPYLVDIDVYQEMMETYRNMILQKVNPIYIDEVGRWELSGQGFDAIIKEALRASIDLILTVRDSFLDQVMDHYHLHGTCVML
jgi:nucleoside-triphosphatase THEP1